MSKSDASHRRAVDSDPLPYLERELQGLTIDACATVKARLLYMRRQDPDDKHTTNEMIERFLAEYKIWRDNPNTAPNLSTLSVLARKKLTEYHNGTIRPMAKMYSDWALENMRRDLKEARSSADGHIYFIEDGDDLEGILSSSEKMRLYQALYRFDTFNLLFGHASEGRLVKRYEEVDDERMWGFTAEEVNKKFVSLFEPWAAESIYCVGHHFLRQVFASTFDKNEAGIRSLLRTDPTIPLDATIQRLRHGFIIEGPSSGLPTVVDVLSSTDYQAGIIIGWDKMLRQNRLIDCSFADAFSVQAQESRYQEGKEARKPHRQDVWQDKREVLLHRGDMRPSGTPPAAWVELWKRYSNLYGPFTPDCIGQGGYYFWDKQRLKATGAKGRVENLWEDERNSLAVLQLIQDIEKSFGWSPLQTEPNVMDRTAPRALFAAAKNVLRAFRRPNHG